MRKFLYIILLSTVLSFICFTSARAESFGFIEIKADVPEGFENSIMINFFSTTNGQNSLFTINSSNQYRLKEKLPVGEYNLDFISIYADNGEFNIESKNAITIKDNSLEEFNITITKKHEESDKILEDTKNTTNEDNLTEQNNNTNDLHLNEKSNSILKELFSISFTTVILILLSIIYLILKYKKERYE